MNKLRLSLLGLAVALVTVVTIAPGVLEASNGASVSQGFGCFLGSGLTGLGVTLTTTETHVVNTPSGNTNFTCQFAIPEGYWPTQTSQFRDFLCGTQYGATDNTFAVVSTDGTAMLRCTIRANS